MAQIYMPAKNRTQDFLPLKPHWFHVTLSLANGEDLMAESGAWPPPDLDDARRRYYRLYGLGRHVLAAESARLEDLVRMGRCRAWTSRRRARTGWTSWARCGAKSRSSIRISLRSMGAAWANI